MPSVAEYLPWDSSFFGLRIGRVCGHTLTAAIVQHLEQWAVLERIDCVYFLAGAADVSTIRIAEQNNFHLMDIRVTLRHLLQTSGPDIPGHDAQIRVADVEDIPILRSIAARSHENSRFYNDEGFSREQCKALYETWIERSCKGYAAIVLVASRQARVQGYITCHLDRQIGTIGLTAVHPEARRTGLGRILVAAALQWFQSCDALEATVVTQGANTAALRLYEQCGFVMRSTELWYHRWFLPNTFH